MEFWENPEYLGGLPFVIVGLIGLAIAAGALFSQPETTPRVRRTSHPTEGEYIKIGLALAVVTAIEVVIYYFDIPRNVFIMILLGLSALKFFLVVLWFMHLRFDSRLFSTLFFGGMVLAISVFVVVLATLNSNLV